MTLLHQDIRPDQPGTHVLAIGVGNYPHLLGGSSPQRARNPLGLSQLLSPPQSVRALVDWFLAPLLQPGSTGFINPDAPLASVEALASSSDPLSLQTPTGAQDLAAATQRNIQFAFEAWLDRLRSHADNIGVFYFCGHGLMVAENYLLASDFGISRAQPWAEAFDLSTTISAVEREVNGALFFFIDACREIKRDVALTLGARSLPLHTVNLDQPVSRKSLTTIFATGEGGLAFAPPGGQVSRFTSALLGALSGFSGSKLPGSSTWDVDGESIARAVRKLLEFDTLETKDKGPQHTQVSEQNVKGTPEPLVRLSEVPKVKVWLDLEPSSRRSAYELYLESAQGGARVAQTQLDQVFRTEVRRGFYTIGATDPSSQWAPVQHADAELTPPTLIFTLKAP